VAGYAILIVMLVFHQVAFEYAIAFLVVVLLFGQLQTAGAILIEEIGFERYRTRDLFWIGGWGLLETFWYRPLTALWRAWATVLWLTGRRASWGTIPRGEALGSRPGEVSRAPEPAPLSR
jgi:hypothetical protein